jgi:hypothetical protein
MRSMLPRRHSFGVAFLFVVMLSLGFSSVAQAQSKSKPAPAPAKPAAAPAKPAAPASKPATSGPGAKPGTTSAGARPGTTGVGARPGTTGAAGTHTGTTGAAGAHAGTTTAGHTTTGAAGAHTTTAGGAKPATGAGTAGKPGAAGAAGGKPAGGAAPAKAPGTVSHPGGGKTVTTKGGNTREFNKSGRMTSVSTRSGHEAHFDSHGRVTSIHTRGGADIHRGPHGERRVVGERVNARGEHYHVVNYGRHGGFVEHGYMRGGHSYMRRTYVYGGRSYAYAYRGYYYHGAMYYHYVPPYYYGPAYYGWAYNPWPAPVPYAWGWGAAPWYGFYGAYFVPAPVYPYAALWLADFLIAENLRLAYEAAAAANADAANASPDYAPYLKFVPPSAAREGVTSFGAGEELEFDADSAAAAMPADVKQMVADEIKSQIQAEKNAAANPNADQGTDATPAALDPNHKVFVVSTTISVPLGDDSCSLTAGDVIQRTEDTPDKDNTVAVKVVSAKSSDCALGSTPRVQTSDLQDMHNDFRQKIDSGMDNMSKGGNGLPTPPDAKKTASADGTVQPDLTAGSDLNSQEADADSAEKEVKAAEAEPQQ